jgi:UDP-N-acetylmuramoylalanine--D-glutamate ligase
MNYRGQRATIMGLGHFGGGVAAARWLARQGAVVTISDAADENALADSLPLPADVPIDAIHLGGHRPEDFQRADLIVVNPAVRPDSPWLRTAQKSDACLCTELGLFIENCPARIIGVTGSNGKSTTAAMIASIITTAGRRAFLGGNIGGSLLDQLPQMTADDWVVLEISSFQLWHFGFRTPHARTPHARTPHAPREESTAGQCRLRVAVVTGCAPNHLDWHGSFADYVAAKRRILMGQTSDDLAVLNSFDAEVNSWLPQVRGRPIPLPQLDTLPTLSVPGEHNRINAACAAAAAGAVGCGGHEIRRGLQAFRGLPQRLQPIAVIDGRRFYNDSTATTPESTIAALRSLDVPMWLLAGGKSKGFDFRPLAAEIVRHARGAAFFGAVRNELLEHVAAADARFPCVAVETMQEALDWCWRRSQPGEAVLLSPACASTDQFRNFHQRGKTFAEMVSALPH